jgi:diacylglycerol kinase (ATP)
MTKSFARTAVISKIMKKPSVCAVVKCPNLIVKIISGFRYSIYGLKYLINDPSWRIELIAMFPVTIIILLFGKTPVEKLFLFCSYFLILIIEALNAAIEAVVDKASPEIHPLAKKSKDIASAAVFIAIVQAFVVWLIILL